jgi:cytochrome c551/c552
VKKLFVVAAVAAVGVMSVSTNANAFNTHHCMACHAIDHDKIGPAWTEDVKAYGTEENLAKVFLSGFKVKDRAIASKSAKWKHKAGLMTGQFNHLIKGHEKAAAHALFMTVKNKKFGDY